MDNGHGNPIKNIYPLSLSIIINQLVMQLRTYAGLRSTNLITRNTTYF